MVHRYVDIIPLTIDINIYIYIYMYVYRYVDIIRDMFVIYR